MPEGSYAQSSLINILIYGLDMLNIHANRKMSLPLVIIIEGIKFQGRNNNFANVRMYSELNYQSREI